MILVFAGNRVDDADRADPRFPQSNVPRVQSLVAEILAESRPDLVVGAAAAGSDLIILSEAQKASIPTHIVLPLDVNEFRRMSVVDQPGDWGGGFDLAISASTAVTVADLSEFDDWYLRGNDLILDTAESLAHGDEIMALVVAASDDDSSVSSDFRRKASARGWSAVSVEPL